MFYALLICIILRISTMVSAQSVLVLFLFCLVNYAHQRKLPPFIKRCKFSTDGKAISECVKNVYNEHRDKFIEGIPKMHVPSLDPFFVDKVVFNTGEGSAIGVNAVFTNMKVSGSKDAVINRVETDVAKGKALLDLYMPHMNIKCDYVVTGRLMVLPINGSGQAEGNFTGIHTITSFEGKFVTRNNKEYVEWTDQKIDLTMSGSSLYFDNLFGDNKQLTETTNKVFNENSEEIIKELKPLVEKTIASITFSLLQNVFHTYSIEELFET